MSSPATTVPTAKVRTALSTMRQTGYGVAGRLVALVPGVATELCHRGQQPMGVWYALGDGRSLRVRLLGKKSACAVS
jgi:hypothetical protein